MWDGKEYKDKCHSIEKLEDYLEKGHVIAKCGKCYSLDNITPATTAEEDCSAIDSLESCGEKDNMLEYPMCMWDSNKEYAPKTKCQNELQLKKYQEKGHVLVYCGSCEDTDFFEGFFPLPEEEEEEEGSKSKKTTNKSQKDSVKVTTKKSQKDSDKVTTKKSQKSSKEDEEETTKEVLDTESCDWDSMTACGVKKNGTPKYDVCL